MELPGLARRLLARRVLTPTHALLGALVAVALLRLATLGTLALTDNTEARYGEIGWQMFRSGDWVTPQLYLGGKLTPFWAKPPLFFWLTAFSFHLLGASEWAARLPNFLIAVALVAGTVAFGRRFWGPREGVLAGLILASSGLFFILGGTCVLDMALTASVSLAMMSFALFARERTGHAPWGRIFFLALGLGCLAKGPVAVVLVALAVGAWIALTSQWSLLRKLPWISGTLIAGVVACPWYILAERATPGFLRYFLINEHLLRYIRSDYGDLYGNGRTQPYGASWIMLLVGFIPWTPVLIRSGINRWRNRRAASEGPRDVWLWYAVIWGLTPAVFFTLCRQILVTYLLPGFPGLALATSIIVMRWADAGDAVSLLRGLRAFCLGLGAFLLIGLAAEVFYAASPWAILSTAAAIALFFWVLRRGNSRGDSTTLLAAMGAGAPLLVAIALVSAAPWIDETFSTKTILQAVARVSQDVGQSVVFPLTDEYSAAFYQEACFGSSLDHPKGDGVEFLLSRLGEPSHQFFVIRRKQWMELDDKTRQRLTSVAETAHWIACRTRTAERVPSIMASGKPQPGRL